MANKQPAFMYYPKDWRSDPVWGCSLAARGLWHEMMDRMHESEQYGYLCEQGKPIPHERIARLCGTTPEEFNALLAELDVVGVPRRTASGIIYCKRMVEDEKKRREWRNRQKDKRLKDRDVTRPVTQMSRGLAFPYSSSNHQDKTSAQTLAHTTTFDPEIKKLQLQAEILGRTERLQKHTSITIGTGPEAQAQVRPEILERIRRREEQKDQIARKG